MTTEARCTKCDGVAAPGHVCDTTAKAHKPVSDWGEAAPVKAQREPLTHDELFAYHRALACLQTAAAKLTGDRVAPLRAILTQVASLLAATERDGGDPLRGCLVVSAPAARYLGEKLDQALGGALSGDIETVRALVDAFGGDLHVNRDVLLVAAPDAERLTAGVRPIVNYEVVFRSTKVGYERFGRALVLCDVKLASAYLFGEATVVAMVICEPVRAVAFALDASPISMKYRPPTVFDNGTLLPMYASAEHEITGQVSPAAQRAIEKNRAQEKRG